MTTADKVTYEVIKSGIAVSTHRSEAQAIKTARKISAEAVTMREKSGTYESLTKIWPQLGDTYSK